MSFQTSSRALKNDILERCGELQDGTSPFETTVMKYLNKVYQDVLAGGSEFGVEVAEPWTWAQAQRPMPITLDPEVNAAATFTQGSTSVTLSAVQAESLRGRYVQVSARADFYKVIKHTAGTASVQLDQPYIQDSGLLNCTFFKFDYDLFDETVVIDEKNQNFDFSEDGSTVLTATVTTGAYTPSGLATALEAALELAGAQSYTCSFNEATRMFTVAQGGAIFSALFASGPNAATSLSLPLGFDIEDQIGAVSYSSSYALSGILRLTKPITVYHDRNTYWDAARDSGKVFHVDQNTFLREYPFSRATRDVPDKFCLIEQGPTGLTKARFNASVLNDPIRAEVNYIPITRKLVDNVVSIPVVPGSYSDFLIYAASSMIMLDKSDSKAPEFRQLAQAKLLSMVNDNRRTTQLAGNNYGRIIPRRNYKTKFPGYGY